MLAVESLVALASAVVQTLTVCTTMRWTLTMLTTISMKTGLTHARRVLATSVWTTVERTFFYFICKKKQLIKVNSKYFGQERKKTVHMKLVAYRSNNSVQSIRHHKRIGHWRWVDRERNSCRRKFRPLFRNSQPNDIPCGKRTDRWCIDRDQNRTDPDSRLCVGMKNKETHNY